MNHNHYSRRPYSRVSIAIIRLGVWFCDSVCPHDKTKTAETKIAKFGTEIVHHNTSLTNEYYVKRSKVMVTGSKYAKRRDETAVRRRVAPL